MQQKKNRQNIENKSEVSEQRQQRQSSQCNLVPRSPTASVKQSEIWVQAHFSV